MTSGMRAFPRRSLLFGLALVCLALSGLPVDCLAAEPDTANEREPAEKMVHFRDGTRLLMHVDGGFELDDGARRLGMAELSRAEFCPVEPGSNLVQFLELTKGLGAARYRDREAASRRLAVSMVQFGELARQYASREKDPEIRFRLEEAIQVSDLTAPPVLEFDALVFRAPNGAMSQWIGDLGAWSATGRVSGVALKLDRSDVALVHDPDMGGRAGMGVPQAAGTAVARANAPKGWGKSALKGSPLLRPLASHEERKGKVRVLGFDKDPGGKELKVGTNVEQVFQDWGCTLASSVEGGAVVVDSYKVGGETGGVSAGNDRPRWEGEITVRFHQPGKPEQAAGVRQAGCYVSSVVKGGISMKFFDLDGGLIGAVPAAESGLAFLGAESEVPIGSVRIVPNPAVDRNYAFDDFFFGSLAVQAPPPARFGLETTRGEIAFGNALEAEDGTWTLRDLSCGLERWQVPQAQLKAAVFGPGSQVTGDVKLPALVRSAAGAKTVAMKIESIAGAEVLGFEGEVLRLRVDGEEREISAENLTAIVF